MEKNHSGEKRFANLDYSGGVVQLDYYPGNISEKDENISKERNAMEGIAKNLEGVLFYSGLAEMNGMPCVSGKIYFGIPDFSPKYVAEVGLLGTAVVDIFLPRIKRELQKNGYEVFGEVVPGSLRKEIMKE